jgi:hypothetical protein
MARCVVACLWCGRSPSASRCSPGRDRPVILAVSGRRWRRGAARVRVSSASSQPARRLPSRYPWKGRLFGIGQSINSVGPCRPRLGKKPPSRFRIRARRRLRGVLALRGSFCALGRTHHCHNPARSHRAAVADSYTLGDQVDLWAFCSKCRSYARCAQHAHAFVVALRQLIRCHRGVGKVRGAREGHDRRVRDARSAMAQ